MFIRQCLANGYHPLQWWRAITIALKKPNKPDYTQPRAYCLITLLECIGKLLEKVVAHRLTYLTGQYNLISGSQFGDRANFSTSDAILIFVYDIHNSWNHSLATSTLTFDIKGYFDFVNREHLLNEMKKHYISLELVKWIANFLSDQEVAICLNSTQWEMKLVKNGILQGSPISSILISFYLAGLLDIFEIPTNPIEIPENYACNHSTHVSILIYVDDGKLTVFSHS